MPWSPSDAYAKNHKATTPTSQRAFAHAANSVLAATGDEGRAVRAGNAAVDKSIAKHHFSAHEERAMRHGNRAAHGA